jgi:hypothetical protein
MPPVVDTSVGVQRAEIYEERSDMSIARSIVTTLFLLLLVVPSLAQNYDWAERTERPSNGWLDFPKGTRATIEAAPCCAPASGGKLPDAVEAEILTQLAGHVSRDDTILRLGLEGGRTLKILDCFDSDVCQAQARVHRLVAWWPASRHYLVDVYVEGGGPYWVYLISEKDGSATPVMTLPVLSPSGRYAIALLSTPVTDPHYFNVIDLTVDPPKVIDVGKPSCAGFDPNSLLRPTPVWVDDSHVRFDGNPPWLNIDLTHKQLLNIAGARPVWEC